MKRFALTILLFTSLASPGPAKEMDYAVASHWTTEAGAGCTAAMEAGFAHSRKLYSEAADITWRRVGSGYDVIIRVTYRSGVWAYQSGSSLYFRINGPVTPALATSPKYWAEVITHEMGHRFGLADIDARKYPQYNTLDPAKGSVMVIYGGRPVNAAGWTVLGAYDIARLRSKYGPPKITPPPPPPPPPPPKPPLVVEVWKDGAHKRAYTATVHLDGKPLGTAGDKLVVDILRASSPLTSIMLIEGEPRPNLMAAVKLNGAMVAGGTRLRVDVKLRTPLAYGERLFVEDDAITVDVGPGDREPAVCVCPAARATRWSRPVRRLLRPRCFSR